jgi:soluble lytic murein transglycosylase-like protein
MGKLAKFLSVVVLAALPALAADVAVLRNGFTIRYERQQELGGITRLYLTADGKGYTDVPTADIDHFEQDLSPEPAPEAASPEPVKTATGMTIGAAGRRPIAAPAARVNLQDVVTSASNTHLIDPDLISSVIHAESNFNPHAVSPKGARGLMQLMPQTASKLGVNNSFDPQANVDGGTKYLRELLELYNWDMVKALAAYNAGPQRVQQYHGVPPYKETRAYVRRIILDFNQKKLAEQKAEAAAKRAAAKTSATKSPATKARPKTAGTSKQAELRKPAP